MGISHPFPAQVKTNIQFTLNVLKHPTFRSGEATTSFIGDNPELFQFKAGGDRASKLLDYLAELAVNGCVQIKSSTRLQCARIRMF